MLATATRLRQAFDPVLGPQATFRALIEVMARPGTIVQLPISGPDAPVNPWAAAMLLTVLDHTTPFAVSDFGGSGAIDQYVRRRTQAPLAAIDSAEFVLAEASTVTTALLGDLRPGTPEFPHESATVIVLVPALGRSGSLGLTLELAGPGVIPETRLGLDGLLPSFFAARSSINRTYPCGIDLFFIDRNGQIVALPRSTRVFVGIPKE